LAAAGSASRPGQNRSLCLSLSLSLCRSLSHSRSQLVYDKLKPAVKVINIFFIFKVVLEISLFFALGRVAYINIISNVYRLSLCF